MNKWTEILLGIILITISSIIWYSNIWGIGTSALEFLKGGVIWAIVIVGLMFLGLGLSSLKEGD